MCFEQSESMPEINRKCMVPIVCLKQTIQICDCGNKDIMIEPMIGSHPNYIWNADKKIYVFKTNGK